VTTLNRIPFGLDRLPRSISIDDPRLPTAPVGPSPLRLNTEPLPQDVMPEATTHHAARIAAAIDWLVSLCGDYAPARRRFVTIYLAFLAAQLDTHRATLDAELARYDGLYAVDDWLWSAPRPLPRAWLDGPDGLIPAEIAFWDGTQPFAIELSARNTPREVALRTAGLSVLRIAPDALTDPAALGILLPAPFHGFWRDQTLPASPFRRPIPRGVLGLATT
jgi:hypothetical protein